jgi:hypothetical protein
MDRASYTFIENSRTYNSIFNTDRMFISVIDSIFNNIDRVGQSLIIAIFFLISIATFILIVSAIIR